MDSVQNWHAMFEQNIRFARVFILVGNMDEAIHSLELANICLSRVTRLLRRI